MLEKDLGPNSVVVQSIDNYLTHPPVAADANAVLQQLLAKIKTVESRPAWDQQKKRWIDRLGQTESIDKTKETDN